MPVSAEAAGVFSAPFPAALILVKACMVTPAARAGGGGAGLITGNWIYNQAFRRGSGKHRQPGRPRLAQHRP